MSIERLIDERWNCQRFGCDVWRFDSYSFCVTQNGTKVIIGGYQKDQYLIPSDDPVTKPENMSDYGHSFLQGLLSPFRAVEGGKYKRALFDNIELLVSLLNLNSKLDPLYRKDGVTYENAVTEHDIFLMLEWCKEHGIPMENSPLGDAFIWKEYRRIGFSVRDFRTALHNLDSAFLLWKRIFLEDTQSSNFYANTPTDQCLSFLGAHFLNYEITVIKDLTNIPPKFSYGCSNMIGVAFSQLFFQCVPNHDDQLGICSDCGSPMLKRRKNHVQCEACSRKRYEKSRKNKEQREATLNAKKTRE